MRHTFGCRIERRSNDERTVVWEFPRVRYFAAHNVDMIVVVLVLRLILHTRRIRAIIIRRFLDVLVLDSDGRDSAKSTTRSTIRQAHDSDKEDRRVGKLHFDLVRWIIVGIQLYERSW